MTWINLLDLLLKSARDSNKNVITHRLTFIGEQFCLVCRWLSFMLLPSPTSWWRFLPSWGWQCTGYWWCCWTSPVPLVDSSCETGDCCEREKTPRVTTHSSMFTIYSMFAVQLTSQLKFQLGTFYVYGSSRSSTVVRWRVDLNKTVFTLLFSNSASVTYFLVPPLFSGVIKPPTESWTTDRVQFSQQINDFESWFVLLSSLHQCQPFKW